MRVARAFNYDYDYDCDCNSYTTEGRPKRTRKEMSYGHAPLFEERPNHESQYLGSRLVRGTEAPIF